MPPYGAAEQRYADLHRLRALFDDLAREVLTQRPPDPRRADSPPSLGRFSELA